MKKLLLSLGTVAAVVAPVASVIACGSDSASNKSNTFTTANANQQTALKALGETIAGQTAFDIDASSTVGIEVKGKDVRFTYTPGKDAKDGASVTRITVSLDTKKVTTLERKVNGEFHDNTKSITELANTNLSIVNDIKDAATALEAASKAAAPAANVDAALKGFKTLDIKTIDDSKMAEAEKKAAIAKVNGAKTVAELTKVMKELESKLGTATPAGSGTATTNTGTGSTNTGTADTLVGKEATVHVTIDAKDFKNLVDAKIALAIQALLKGESKTTTDIDKITVIADDAGTSITKSGVVSHVAKNNNANVNNTIQAISQEIAIASGHDIDTTDTSYIQTINDRLAAIPTGTTEAIARANAIFEAVGNATRFIVGNKYQPVFGDPVDFTGTDAKDEITKLLAPFAKAFPSIKLQDAINLIA